jgi:putative flippase GtrA
MLKLEAARFIVVGIVSLIADFAVYRGLLIVDPGHANAWKAAGFIVGTTVAFALNKKWTFGRHDVGMRRAVPRFLIVYAATLVLNVATNAFLLSILPDSRTRILVAFLFASAVSAAGNFAGLKWFVFRAAEGERSR